LGIRCAIPRTARMKRKAVRAAGGRYRKRASPNGNRPRRFAPPTDEAARGARLYEALTAIMKPEISALARRPNDALRLPVKPLDLMPGESGRLWRMVFEGIRGASIWIGSRQNDPDFKPG